MRKKAIRALSTLLAVLMVVLAVPAMPIFGGTKDVKQITFAYSNMFYFWDPSENVITQDKEGGSLEYVDANRGFWLKKDSPANYLDPQDITWDGKLYTITPDGGGLNFKPKDSGSFDSAFRFVPELKDEFTNIKVKFYWFATGQENTKKEIPYVNGAYQLSLKTLSSSITSITIKAVATYEVSWTNTAEYHISYGNGTTASPATVEAADSAGPSFKFTLQLESAALNNLPVVKVWGQKAEENKTLEYISGESNQSEGKYIYQIDNIRGDRTITVDLKPPLSVAWDTPANKNYSIVADSVIEYGKDQYQFSIEASAGWEVSVAVNANYKTYTVGSNGELTLTEPGTDGSGTYTLKPAGGIFTDVKISISAAKKTFDVKLKKQPSEQDGYTTNIHDTTVEYEGSYDFKVTPKDGYDLPKVSIEPSSGATLTQTGNDFRISKIKQHITIVIDDAPQQTFKVTLPSENTRIGYELTYKFPEELGLSNLDEVPWGTNITLSIEVKQDYTQSIPSVYVNGALKNSDKVDQFVYTYNITVKDNTDINVSTLSKNTHTITVPTSADGFGVEGVSATVTAGGTYKFSVKLNEGYEFKGSDAQKELFQIYGTELMPAVPKNVTITPNDGNTIFTVVINEIRSDLRFEIDYNQIQRKTFTVKKPGEQTGFSFDWSGAQETDPIYYNYSRAFKVKPTPGYVVKQVTVTSGAGKTEALTATGEEMDTYTINEIKDNYTIDVVCKPITVTVVYEVITTTWNSWKIIEGKSDTKTYTFGVDSEFSAFDNNLKLQLWKEKDALHLVGADNKEKSGFIFDGWYDNSTIGSTEQVTEWNRFVLNKEDQGTLHFYAIFEMEEGGDENIVEPGSESKENPAPFFGVDESLEEKRKNPVAKNGMDTFAGAIELQKGLADSLLGDKLTEEVNNPETNETTDIVAMGLLYSGQTFNPYDYVKAIKDLHKSGQTSGFLNGGDKNNLNSVYCYYYGEKYASQLNLGEGFDLRIHSQAKSKRYGAVWFLVRIAKQEYLFFGEVLTCDFSQQES